jgi:hypothetical protein
VPNRDAPTVSKTAPMTRAEQRRPFTWTCPDRGNANNRAAGDGTIACFQLIDLNEVAEWPWTR